MCKVLKVSRSSYYRWLSHGLSKRAIEHSLFTELIEKEFDVSGHTYGSTRITEQLRRKQHRISRRRVAKIMKENGWVNRHRKKFKVTTDTEHGYPICRNLLEQNFNTIRLNEIGYPTSLISRPRKVGCT